MIRLMISVESSSDYLWSPSKAHFVSKIDFYDDMFVYYMHLPEKGEKMVEF